MGVDRRIFLNDAGAIVGCTLGRFGIAEAEAARNGRTPITKQEWGEIVRGGAAGTRGGTVSNVGSDLQPVDTVGQTFLRGQIQQLLPLVEPAFPRADRAANHDDTALPGCVRVAPRSRGHPVRLM